MITEGELKKARALTFIVTIQGKTVTYAFQPTDAKVADELRELSPSKSSRRR